MKKYNNVNYHSVSMHEFQKVLSDITCKDELFMKQFTFVHNRDIQPYFCIEFCNISDHNLNICIYVDFPATVPIMPFEVLCRIELLMTDLGRFGFRYCYPQFSIFKCDTNDYQNPMD